MRGHQGRVISNFRGDFDRGDPTSTPLEHFVSSKNIQFQHKGAKTRVGSVLDTTIANVVRFHLYEKDGEAQRKIILDSAGKFWDSTNLVTPILTIPAATDFDLKIMFNRAYITPTNGTAGLPGEFIYVYDGSGTARKAGGDAPSGFTLVVADSASSGNVEAGERLYAVAYETVSGFITNGGPIGTLPRLTSAGGKKVDVSAIPVGPSYVVKRHILATKVIVGTYSGRERDYELFFVPDGEIDNNVDTTKTIDFFDTELVKSADFLLDQLSEIPATLFLAEYAGRLVGGREDTKKHTVRVSKSGEPESFSSIDGFINVRPGDVGGGVSAAQEYRTWFYITKGKRTYVTRSNGSAPSSWEVNEVDGGIGTESPFGIGRVLNSKGSDIDKMVVADTGGLYLFSGVYLEQELSWFIREVWDRINDEYAHLIQVVLDHVAKEIYIIAPIDSSTTVNRMLMADYKNGLNPQGVRWCSEWALPAAVKSIAVAVVNRKPVLLYSHGTNIYKLDPTTLNDYNNAIPCDIVFAPQTASTAKFLSLSHFIGLRSIIRGSGNLDITVSNHDDTVVSTPPSIVLGAASGKAREMIFDHTGEYCKVKFSLDAINEWFVCSSFFLAGKQSAGSRPSV